MRFEGSKLIGISSEDVVNGVLEVPDFVTSIGDEVAKYFNELKVVILPKSLEKLGEKSFANCKNLEKCEGNTENLIEIGEKCFYGCEKLKMFQLKFKKGAELSKSVFENCLSLLEIDLNGVKNIGSECFCGCEDLIRLTGLNEVESIGDYCFDDCSNLKELSLMPNLISCGEMIFYGCSNLPAEVKNIVNKERTM